MLRYYNTVLDLNLHIILFGSYTTLILTSLLLWRFDRKYTNIQYNDFIISTKIARDMESIINNFVCYVYQYNL